MAQMFPDNLPTKASQGEKLLYTILKERLPQDCRVWYEPDVRGTYPDFIILSSTFGLLILEVKGWYANQIVEATSNFFQIRQQSNGQTHVESRKPPLRQGHDYYGVVADRLKGYNILTQLDGDYKGRLAFPIGVGAIMSNITEPQARDGGLYIFLEKPQVAYRDEFQSWQTWDETQLTQRLQAMFRKTFAFPTLTPDQISTIQGVLYPEVKVREVLATQMSLPVEVEAELPANSMKIITLDIDQEKLARSLRDGHHLFSGVAGSGKTLILLARAKALANRLQEHQILILCFNITLASHLRSVLHGDLQNPHYRERIEVHHFNDWARSLLGRLPNPREFTSSEEYDQFLGAQVLSILQQRPLEQKWDSVLVDEAHTFEPQWFLCCVAALKQPIEGDLMIVSDGNQSLYKRRRFTWRSVGIRVQGGQRSKQLEQNYRNTQEILSAAWSVVQPLTVTGQAVEEDPAFPIVSPSAALRQGAKPVLHQCVSKAKAVSAVIEKAQQLSQAGYAPGEIAILYRYKTNRDESLFQEVIQRLSDLGLHTYWITENQESKRDYGVEKPGIRLVTAHSALGLEFKVVLLLWLEQFAEACSSEPEKAALTRRLLYVAMTRAQDELHLFSGGRCELVEELVGSQEVEVSRSVTEVPTVGSWQGQNSPVIRSARQSV